jgi:hypothetical protein
VQKVFDNSREALKQRVLAYEIDEEAEEED